MTSFVQGPRRPEVLTTLSPKDFADINFETVHNISKKFNRLIWIFWKFKFLVNF